MKKFTVLLALTTTLSSTFSMALQSNDRCLANYYAASRSYDAEKTAAADTNLTTGAINSGAGALALAGAVWLNSTGNKNMAALLAVGGAPVLGSGLVSLIIGANNHKEKLNNPYDAPIALLSYVYGQNHQVYFQKGKDVFDQLYKTVTKRDPHIDYQELQVLVLNGFYREDFCGYFPATIDTIADYVVREAQKNRDHLADRSFGKNFLQDERQADVQPEGTQQ